MPNHQIWKHKGEEYRIYGGGGWEWVSQNRKRKLLEPITKDERAKKIKKFEKTFDEALKRKLSKKHKIALEAKKVKVSKPGEAQPNSTSQARVGTTGSTARARGGATVNVSRIGVSTAAQATKTLVANTVAKIASSTVVPAVQVVTASTVAGKSPVTTVRPSGQTQITTSTSVTSAPLLSKTSGQTTSVVTSPMVATAAGQPLVGIGSPTITTGGTISSLSGTTTVVTGQVPSSQENISTTMPTSQSQITNTVNTVQTVTTPVTQVKPTAEAPTSIIPIPAASNSGVSQETVSSTASAPSGTSVTTTMPDKSTTLQIPPTTFPPINPEGSTTTSGVDTPPVQSSKPIIVSSTKAASRTTTDNASATTSADVTVTATHPSLTETATSNLPVNSSTYLPTTSDTSSTNVSISVSNPSTTASNAPTTTCHSLSEVTAASPVHLTTSTSSATETGVTVLNSNVSTTYCTLPPVSSTLPAVIFDEPKETSSSSITIVPSSTKMTSVSTSQNSIVKTAPSPCASGMQLSSDKPTSNNCGDAGNEHTPKNTPSSVKLSDDLVNNHSDGNSNVMSGAPSQILHSTPRSDNKANPVSSDGKQADGKTLRDATSPQDLSSSNKNETLSCSMTDTDKANESSSNTAVKDSVAVEKMEVDDAEKQSNDTGLATSLESDNTTRPLAVGQDVNKNIPSSNANEPISSTSSQVSQPTSSQPSATQKPASQVSATTTQISVAATTSQVSVSQVSASQATASQVLATVSQMPAKCTQVSSTQVAATSSQVSASQSTVITPSSMSTVRIEASAGMGLNNLTPEKVLKFIADELMKESDAGKALLTGVAASISTSEGKVIIKPEPATTSTDGSKSDQAKQGSAQTSTPVRLILQTVPGHSVLPGSIPSSRIQVLKNGPQVVHTGVSQGKPLTPIAPAQRIVISNLPSGTVLGSQVLGAQNIPGTKVIRMTIPRAKGSTPVASSPKVVTTGKSSTPTATLKTPVTPKVLTQATTKTVTENFPMRHAVIKDPKALININIKKWKRRCSRKSIFVLDKNMIQSLARRGGLKEVQGFHYNTKWNSLNYPQDFPRPSLMTAWRYRTQSIRTLAAAAIQTRILNASMKWDEMNIRPPRGSSNTLKTSSGKAM